MFLGDLDIPKAPLRYGTDACWLQLCDSTYSRDIVALRNSDLGPYLNRIHVRDEEHEQWMASRSVRPDILDFVILIQGAFGGTVSFTDIEPGKRCEFGRMMIPNDGRRVYTLAVEFLGMSFGFEVLGLEEIYCAVVEKNETILRLHLRNGWKFNSSYDREAVVNGSHTRLVGLSVSRDSWPDCFAGMKGLVKRLLDKNFAPVVFAPEESVTR